MMLDSEEEIVHLTDEEFPMSPKKGDDQQSDLNIAIVTTQNSFSPYKSPNSKIHDLIESPILNKNRMLSRFTSSESSNPHTISRLFLEPSDSPPEKCRSNDENLLPATPTTIEPVGSEKFEASPEQVARTAVSSLQELQPPSPPNSQSGWKQSSGMFAVQKPITSYMVPRGSPRAMAMLKAAKSGAGSSNARVAPVVSFESSGSGSSDSDSNGSTGPPRAKKSSVVNPISPLSQMKRSLSHMETNSTSPQGSPKRSSSFVSMSRGSLALKAAAMKSQLVFTSRTSTSVVSDESSNDSTSKESSTANNNSNIVGILRQPATPRAPTPNKKNRVSFAAPIVTSELFFDAQHSSLGLNRVFNGSPSLSTLKPSFMSESEEPGESPRCAIKKMRSSDNATIITSIEFRSRDDSTRPLRCARTCINLFKNGANEPETERIKVLENIDKASKLTETVESQKDSQGAAQNMGELDIAAAGDSSAVSEDSTTAEFSRRKPLYHQNSTFEDCGNFSPPKPTTDSSRDICVVTEGILISNSDSDSSQELQQEVDSNMSVVKPSDPAKSTAILNDDGNEIHKMLYDAKNCATAEEIEELTDNDEEEEEETSAFLRKSCQESMEKFKNSVDELERQEEESRKQKTGQEEVDTEKVADVEMKDVEEENEPSNENEQPKENVHKESMIVTHTEDVFEIDDDASVSNSNSSQLSDVETFSCLTQKFVIKPNNRTSNRSSSMSDDEYAGSSLCHLFNSGDSQENEVMNEQVIKKPSMIDATVQTTVNRRTKDREVQCDDLLPIPSVVSTNSVVATEDDDPMIDFKMPLSLARSLYSYLGKYIEKFEEQQKDMIK